MSEDNGYADDFSDFDGRIWLNSAHRGPLPEVAARAAIKAVGHEQYPSRLNDEDFVEVPRRLKAAIAALIGVPSAEVILGNSTSYGLHLLAHGLPLKPGDEVLLVDGDFPATVLPWTAVRGRGARVRLIRPAGAYLTADDLDREIGAATRVVCTSWVFSLTGYAVDLAEIGALCRDRDVTFVVNASQALGARTLDLTRLPVDALVSCGHKWLCGPYGTGLCWVRPDLLDELLYEQPYWLHAQQAADLGSGVIYEAPPSLGAARYDVFATANFFNFRAWTAALSYLLDRGPAQVAAHDARLVDRFIAGLDRDAYRLTSPVDEVARSTLVLLTHRDAARNADIYEALRSAGVDVALRAGKLRVSPHIHNTDGDIDRALQLLSAAGNGPAA